MSSRGKIAVLLAAVVILLLITFGGLVWMLSDQPSPGPPPASPTPLVVGAESVSPSPAAMTTSTPTSTATTTPTPIPSGPPGGTVDLLYTRNGLEDGAEERLTKVLQEALGESPPCSEVGILIRVSNETSFLVPGLRLEFDLTKLGLTESFQLWKLYLGEGTIRLGEEGALELEGNLPPSGKLEWLFSVRDLGGERGKEGCRELTPPAEAALSPTPTLSPAELHAVVSAIEEKTAQARWAADDGQSTATAAAAQTIAARGTHEITYAWEGEGEGAGEKGGGPPWKLLLVPGAILIILVGVYYLLRRRG